MHVIREEILSVSLCQGINVHKYLREKASLLPPGAGGLLALDWFNGTYKLFNERAILIANDQKKSRRPDRVMIKGDTAIVVDYKFAREREEHSTQVKLYMDLLKKIGYKNVRGYLWYVYKNDIKEI